MRIHAEFDQRVLITPDEMEWVPSPLPGVDRRMLDRIGGEVARATLALEPARRLVLTAGPAEGDGVFLVAGPEDWVRETGPRVATGLEGRGGGKGRFQGKAQRLGERERVLGTL